jgi:hypothetical protein
MRHAFEDGLVEVVGHGRGTDRQRHSAFTRQMILSEWLKCYVAVRRCGMQESFVQVPLKSPSPASRTGSVPRERPGSQAFPLWSGSRFVKHSFRPNHGDAESLQRANEFRGGA